MAKQLGEEIRDDVLNYSRDIVWVTKNWFRQIRYAKKEVEGGAEWP